AHSSTCCRGLFDCELLTYSSSTRASRASVGETRFLAQREKRRSLNRTIARRESMPPPASPNFANGRKLSTVFARVLTPGTAVSMRPHVGRQPREKCDRGRILPRWVRGRTSD